LLPRDLAGEAQVLRWSIAALNTIEIPLLSLWFVNFSGGKGTEASKSLHGWADKRLKQLDGWLENRQFVAIEDFTVADILMTHVLGGGTDQELLKPYANILAYLARCTGRRPGRRHWTHTATALKPRNTFLRALASVTVRRG
jgi:glutathione S-transferase